MANDVSETNFLAFVDFPFEILSFNEHDNSWSKIEVSELISFFEIQPRANDDSSDIQSSNHNHVQVSSLPSSWNTKPRILFVDFLSSNQSFFTYTIKSPFNCLSFLYSELSWSMESVIITWSQVKYDLVQFVFAVFLQLLNLFLRITDFFAFHQFSQRVRCSFYDWAFVLSDLRNLQNFAISWTNNCRGVCGDWSWFYFPGEKGAEGFERVERFHDFIKFDVILFGVKGKEFLS